MAQVTFGYWGVRGLGQVSRLLLSYTNTPFKEVAYSGTQHQKWFEEDKKNIGFDFPNLPYLIDGDFKLTESAAIAKYIIKRSGHNELLGKNVEDEGVVNNIIGVLNDTFKEVRGILTFDNWSEVKDATFEKVKPKLELLNKFIGNKEFALGYLTLVDFYIAEHSYYFEALYEDQRQKYPFWWNIRQNFEKLPGVRAYYLRENAITGPFSSPPYLKKYISYRKVKLGYWGIRGLGQVPRLLLSYSGVDFQDHHYTDGDQWFKADKQSLGLNFPNLPYLIDGKYNITESQAIQRYIIKRWGKAELLGKDHHDYAKLESFLSVFNEVAGAVRGLFFNKDYETVKAETIAKYLPKLEELQKFVGEKKFVLGYLTLADFIVAEDSHYIERLFPEEYARLTFLPRIREEFNSLPEIAAYYSSKSAFKGRFFPIYAAVSVERE